VLCGSERWIGRDDTAPVAGDPPRGPGALVAIKAAVDTADLAHTAPAGSLFALVTYADRVLIRVPLGPIERITGAALGEPRDYAGAAGDDLVRALELAVATLEHAPMANKQLVVVSDGTDGHGDAVKDVAELNKRIATLGITVTAIVYPPAASSDRNALSALTARSTTVASTDALEHAVGGALAASGR